MGFKVPERNAVITFEGTDFDGAEMHCRLRVPLRMFLNLQRLGGGGPDDVERAYLQFGEQVLKSWNIEDDDGAPLPATGEGFLSLPTDFQTLVFEHWIKAVSEPSAPLESPQLAGVT